MAFASNEERLALANAGDFPSLLTVQIITRDGREVEIAADGVDHALAISGDWLVRRGARQTEIFRVERESGALIPTVGATRPTPAQSYSAFMAAAHILDGAVPTQPSYIREWNRLEDDINALDVETRDEIARLVREEIARPMAAALLLTMIERD